MHVKTRRGVLLTWFGFIGSVRRTWVEGDPAERVRGAEVRSAALVKHERPVTYDLLVEGGDGTYRADGIALGSTMLPR